MEKCIILIMQNNKNLEPISFLEELCVCDDDGHIKIFDTLSEADTYREKNSIDGQIVPLPYY